MNCGMPRENKFNLEFPLQDNEKIIHKGYANMHDSDYIVNGALYLTDARIVFVGLVPHNNTKVTCSIFLSRIEEVKKEKSLLFLSNVLRVLDCDKQDYKFIVKDQKEWHAQILRQLNQPAG